MSRGRFAASGLCRRNERRRNTLLNNFTPMHVKTVLHSYGVRREIFTIILSRSRFAVVKVSTDVNLR